ncbi:MAG: hypothetical protein ABFD46_02105 [Armatimonadota bacterium]
MKKCPKCGADNKPDSSACYNCFAPLTDVRPAATPGPLNAQPLTGPEKTQPIPPAQNQQPTVSVPLTGGQTPRSSGPLNRPLNGPLNGPLTGQSQDENQQTVVGQPLGGQQQKPPSPYGPQPGPYAPPSQQQYRRREEFIRPEPVKSSGPGAMIAIILLVLAIIGGGIFTYMKYHKPEDNTPIGVVRAFTKAAESGNKQEMKKYLTKGSEDSKMINGLFDPDRLADSSSSRIGKKTFKEGIDYTLQVTSSGNNRAIVSEIIQQTGYSKIESILMEQPNVSAKQRQMFIDLFKRSFQSGIPVVTVVEDGKWKIDGPQTEQALQELLQKFMVEMFRMIPQMTR